MHNANIFFRFFPTLSDSVTIQPSGRLQIHENGNLFISNVQESDSGSYSCIRSNEAGTVSGEAFLGVLGKNILCKFYIHREYPSVEKERMLQKKLNRWLITNL